MKILYLIHQFFPEHHAGTEKFVLNLSTAMLQWGHRAKVLTYRFEAQQGSADSAAPVTLEKYTYKGVEILSVKEAQPPHSVHSAIGNAALSRVAEMVLREESPDVFHIAHTMRMSEFALAAARLSIPYLVTMTDFFLMCPKCTLITDQRSLCWGPERGSVCAQHCTSVQPDSVPSRLVASEGILRNAASVVAPSHFLGTLFRREFPFLQPKVIPYGIDYSRISVNRRRYTGIEDFIVLYAGQLDYHKGVHVLIDAVKRVRSSRLRLKLYGAGPEHAVKQFKEMAKGDDRISFCGVYKEEAIGEVFGAADVVTIPSNWHENNTIVMREAIASHLPCIVSDASGMTEKIRNGVNGFVFPMGDSMALQRVLEMILEDPNVLASVKANMFRSPIISVEQEAYAYEREYRQIQAAAVLADDGDPDGR